MQGSQVSECVTAVTSPATRIYQYLAPRADKSSKHLLVYCSSLLHGEVNGSINLHIYNVQVIFAHLLQPRSSPVLQLR